MKQAILNWLEDVLFERFGHRFELKLSAGGLTLFPPEPFEGFILFDKLLPAFYQTGSDFLVGKWNAQLYGWSSASGQPFFTIGVSDCRSPLISRKDNAFVIHYDILGLTYWMLTRLEEVGKSDLDVHGRFQGTASHAYKNGYLDRPVVDEWLDLLKQVIERQWPGISMQEHQFSIKVSHDVDVASRYGFCSLKDLLLAMGVDVIKKHDLRSAALAPIIWLNTKSRIHPEDSAHTFDWLMDQSDKNNLVSAFYFICGRTVASMDALYDIGHPAIRSLLAHIHSRGHEIGLHPSYGTFREPSLLKMEADRLKSVCAEQDIEQDAWGSRMHYLRWETPTTLRALNDAGIAYDTTLGYADLPGFRCGTCFEYPAFDPIAKERLKLRVRPLVAMDCTVITDTYLGLGLTEEAFQRFNELKLTCKKVNGQFTLLWHNSFFSTEKSFDIYSRLLN